MKAILSVALLIIAFSAAAQKSLNVPAFPIIDKGSYFKLNFLSIADFRLPTIQAGYEYKFSNRVGAEVAFGIPLGFIANRKTDSTYFNFYKIRGTLKYYVNKRNAYFGLESFYTHVNSSSYNYAYFLDKPGNKYLSGYIVSKKTVAGFDIKQGRSYRLTEKLYLENFIGIGVRFVTIKLPVNIDPRPVNNSNNGYIFDIESLDLVGTKITPLLTFGLELVYKL